MCLKGFVNRLSHDCPLGIDHDVSTTHCWSSSGDSVDSLSKDYLYHHGCYLIHKGLSFSQKRGIGVSY